ncbi:bcl-2-related ovarian killer protein-like [Asterias rubens]|uniref:bcl-2-related ovarian killer protein-like n=1 Tax=Asterias rubens TaxID=7604 RepID=UPI0014559341|nr:bcl-2-related ovarian killer protein-like [Asterias rubens]
MPSLEDRVSEEAVMLCNEFIYLKLRQRGLLNRGRQTAAVKLIPTAATKKARHQPKEITIQDTVLELQMVSAEMEQRYPNLFKDVFTQLNIRVTSEEVVEEAVTAVASEIFRSGITWARVVAMFAVAATLAAECVQQRTHDHAAFVDRVVRSLSHFVRENLAEWIAREGGWGDMTTTFRGVKEDDSNMLMTIGVVGALCGFAGTILATGKLQDNL